MSIKVSIIVPTYNEEKFIEANLLGIINCDFPKDELEVIYVDGMSGDNTTNIICRYMEKYSFIKLYKNEKKFTPFAINIGIQNAKGKYVIVSGAHSQLDKGYVSKLTEVIGKIGCEAVGGVIMTELQHRNRKSVAIKKVLSNKFGVGNATYRVVDEDMSIREVDTAGFLCYDKQFLINIGMYNEKLIRNQDIELNRRIKNNGGKIFLVPEARVKYFCRESYMSLAQNNFKNGIWNLLTIYYTKNFSSLSLRHFIPLIFVLSLLGPMVLTLLWKPFAFVSMISFVAYNLFAFSQARKINDSETNIWCIVKAFYTLHFSYGMGSCCGIFKMLKLITYGEK